jgi:hypothetical protein
MAAIFTATRSDGKPERLFVARAAMRVQIFSRDRTPEREQWRMTRAPASSIRMKHAA